MKTRKIVMLAVFLTMLTMGLAAQAESDFTYELNTDKDGIVITGYTGKTAAVRIPTAIEGFPVLEIGDGAFSGNAAVASVVMPNGLVKIGAEAFCSCDLRSVTLPAGLVYIGDRAFSGCRSLTSVTLPDGLVEIGEGAFADCRSLTSITIPDSVTTIGGYAFN